MSEQTIDTQIKDTQTKREDRAAGGAVLCIFAVLFASWGAYLLVAISLLTGHFPWLSVYLSPKMQRLAEVSGFGLVPLFLILAAFPKTRLAAGMGFFAVSGAFTFVTAVTCALYVYMLWSWEALLLGSLLMGYGIIPVGIVAALLHHQWSIIGIVVSGTIMLFGTMYFGLALMTLSFSSQPLRVTDMEQNE
jgi:hypothetical protein